MKESINNFYKIFKKVFLLSVLILIIIEFRKIFKEINIADLKNSFKGLSFVSIIAMAIYGICANIPASLYDFILNKELENDDLDKRYIAETGFTINNFNDLLGLGGFISIGLREAFYGKNHDTSDVLKKILELLVFLPTGLAFFSILSLLSLLFYPNANLKSYIVILIGASLYLVFILILIVSKKIKFKKKNQIKLFAISIAEWFGVMSSFVVIGILMGLKFDIIKLSTLVVAANIIGYISMIPGSIGSFDLIILFALSSQGIDKEIALLWILLYRLFYYLIPFFIALFFFTRNFTKAYRFKDEIYIKKLVKNIIVVINSFMMYIFGLFMILSTTLPDKAYGHGMLARLNPIRATAVYQFPSILLGFLFIIMARAYISRQKKSFILNVLVLSISLVYTYMTGYSFVTNLYLIFMFIMLILTRKELYTKQFLYANEDRLVDMTIANTMIIIYVATVIKSGSVVDVNISKNSDFVIIPFENNFISIIITISLIYVIVLFVIKYLQGAKILIGEKFDKERFINLCQSQGGSKESFLAFLNDKNLYWYKEDNKDLAVLQFRRVSDRLIVMGDPVGNQDYFDLLLENFINQADDYGYNIVFYEISKEITLKIHEYGFNFMKFGESANVDLKEFNLEGKKKKNLRKTINKIDRDGYSFEVLEKPHTGKTIQKLKEVSDSWLGKEKEKGFSLGFFDKEYLNESDIAIVKNELGEIIAFANIAPTFLKDSSTVDLMRYRKDQAPDGLMDYLFINIFNYCKENNIDNFDLGMAPLSNVGIKRHSFLQEKLVYTIFKLGDYFYSFEGLKSYKDKYATSWEERYLSYSKGSYLVFSALALIYASNKR